MQTLSFQLKLNLIISDFHLLSAEEQEKVRLEGVAKREERRKAKAANKSTEANATEVDVSAIATSVQSLALDVEVPNIYTHIALLTCLVGTESNTVVPLLVPVSIFNL
jgi:hypothetical protein